jgi:hypothetical protein
MSGSSESECSSADATGRHVDLLARVHAASSLPPREVRGEPWGGVIGTPFAIAKIFRNGVHVGWGCTCHLHSNRAASCKTPCKKTIVFGKHAALDDATCVVHLKRWLLMGLSIDRDHPTGRHKHIGIDLRQRCKSGVPEDKLDPELAKLWAVWQNRWGR